MEYYIKLNTASAIRLPLTLWVKNNNIWIHKNAFDIALVPLNLLGCKTIQQLTNKFKATPVIFRMQPWQFYRFHTDAARSCAINMLLEGTDSNTYYGSETDDEEVLNIQELNYEIDRYYLLNTHEKHCVINRDNVRYMFSLGFPTDVNYAVVRDYCQEHGL